MRNALAIARKELSIYFTTPWAWVVFTAMAVLSSFFFIQNLGQFAQVQEMAKAMTWGRVMQMYPQAEAFKNLTDGVLVPLVNVLLVIMLFMAPFLSMRLFAEEKKQRTMELLLTTPVRTSEVVIGKYLGGLGVVTATLLVTMIYPVILAIFGASESGTALEWSTVLLGYGALWLFGATCIGIGMLMSSLTESQMLAAVLTFAVLLPWLFLQSVGMRAEEPYRSAINYISFSTQLENMMKGVLDLKAIVFFATIIIFALFATHRAVESQRWT
ncbi:MAG: ABC transporter permease [Myxococcaceae bacterium]|nr:ABC transporter permease [Myxococcaceae bacterium]